MAALLHIGTTDGSLLEQLRESGVDIRSGSAATKTEEPFDVVVIASDVTGPLQVARTVRGDAPDAHIVFVTTPERDPLLRRELLVGRIGSLWSIAPANEPDAAADVVRQAIAGTERRRKLRTTIGRINLRLAQPAVEAPRRTVISDHFLASVLDQLSDAIVVLDPAGTVLAYNAAAAAAFGTIRRGAPFGETLPAAARDAINAASAAPEGRAESHLIAPQIGVEYGLRATSLHDAEGKRVGIALVARDITAGRKEEKRRQLVAEAVRVLASTLDVKEAMQYLTNVLVADFADVAAADIIDGDDVNRVAVSGNTAELAMLMERSRGYNLTSNRSHPSLVAIDRGEPVLKNDVDEVVVREVAANDEHFATVRGMSLRAFLATPLRSADDTVGSIVVGRTSTEPFTPEDVEMMQEIARQTATALHNIWSYHAAAETGRLKDEFLATLSHELRTPMTAILGWAQILRLGENTPDVIGDGLDAIERSARAQAQLIDDLLDLSRMQMGKLQFQARPFSLTAVVRAAVDTVRPAAQAKQVALEFEATRDLVINGDPDRMQQVIWNLLSNAVKFSEAGTEVCVTVTSRDSNAEVAVKDKGRGIAPEFLPHVFERFRQADSATTRRFGGLGLGLAIVKQLVELHGGTVRATSPGLGRGATFTIAVPLASSPRAQQTEAPDAEPAQLANLAGIDVIVVEDDPESAATLTAILKLAGATVRTTSSVASALEELRTRLPNVIVSDVAMPDEDGLALIRAIRVTLRIPAERLPAIALTAFTDVNLRVAVLGAGFQRFMTKPVDANKLTSAIAACGRRRT